MKMSNAAGIAYLHNGRVLLVKRDPSSEQGGTWGFPGGHIEIGETPQQAAMRESVEEVGYLPMTPMSFVSDDGNFVTYKISGEYFTPSLNREHTAHQWASLGSLPQPLHPGVAETLHAIGATMSKRVQDINGWAEVRDNPISKVGVFPYSGRAIGDLENPDRVYRVYRPAEELGHPETIESFRLLPFINDHPNAMLGSAELDLPTVDGKAADGVIGEQVYFKDGYLYGNLKFFTDRIVQAMGAGKKQVSAGFRCMYEKAAGSFNGEPYDYIQRKIRGNHIALVTEGRMGPEVAVLDHLTMTFDSKELIKMADELDKDVKTGEAEMTLAEVIATVKAVAPQIKALQDAMAALSPNAGEVKVEEVVDEDEDEDPAKTDVEPAVLDALKTGMDALEKQLKAITGAVSKLQGSALDAKGVFTASAERDALYRDVSQVTGAFDHSAMDALEVAQYGLDKFGLKDIPAGTEIVAVRSYLAAKPGKHSAIAMDAKATNADSPIRKHVANA